MLSIKLTVVSDEVIYLLLLKVLVTKNYHLFYSETAVIYLLVMLLNGTEQSIFKHLGNLYYGNVFSLPDIFPIFILYTSIAYSLNKLKYGTVSVQYSNSFVIYIVDLSHGYLVMALF